MVARYLPLLPSEGFTRRVACWAVRMTTHSALVVVAVLAGVLGLIVAATRLFQFTTLWRPQPRAGRTLVLRESVALDPRRRVHLIQCGHRQVVLLTGGGTDLIVGWLQEQ